MYKLNKLFIAMSLIIFTSAGIAQSVTNGTLIVDVSDGDNSVASATVSIENTGTGLTRSASSNSNGSARLGSLPTGKYVVTISASGYANNTAEVSISTGLNAVSYTHLTLPTKRIE